MTEAAKPKKGRTPRTPLAGNKRVHLEFAAAPDPITAGYLRSLIAGLRGVKDEAVVEFNVESTTVTQ